MMRKTNGFLLKQKLLMNKYMFKKISFLVVIVIITFSLGACFKKQTAPTPTADSGLLGSLAKQGELKKISSVADLKTFFENRPNVSASAYVMADGVTAQADSSVKTSAPMGLGAGPAAMPARAGGEVSVAKGSETGNVS
jgi:hypothetical protein